MPNLLSFRLTLAIVGVVAIRATGGVVFAEESASAQLAAIVDEVSRDAKPPGLDADLVTFDDVDRDAYEARALTERLDGIPDDDLSPIERQTVEILKWNAWVATQQPRLFWYYSPLMPARSPLRGVRARAKSQKFESDADVGSYLEAVENAGQTVEAIHDNVRGRLARGIALPAEQIDRVLPPIREFAATDETNPLWIAKERFETLSDKGQRAQDSLRDLLGTQVGPAAASLAHYVDHEVRRHAHEGTGWGQYPGGQEAYAIATRVQTTLDVTPAEVHQIGLAAVDDINRQMAEVRDRLGFTGTKAEFHQKLRDDLRFYVDEPEEFGQALLDFDARLRPHVSKQFGIEQQAPYSVRRVAPSLEATMTYGYYNLPTDDDPNGYYNYNGSALESRSLLSGAGLTYHELIPGHHFQLNIQMENEELPVFRQRGYYAGYSEGWGEYSSSVVARELGMYEDPYDLYGRLVFDMFFAVRLVVDTGMNHLGWPRDRAREYMAEHTMESAVQIDSETIRYSMRSPAQALAYRMGRETWVKVREKAERELGDGFDVREFHDSVLLIGSVPLFVLEDHVDRFIEQERR